MQVVLGSLNEAKLQAVDTGFRSAFPDDEVAIRRVDAKSGVSEHPVDGSESLEGALQRVSHARELLPGSDYYVGIEGGLISVGDRVLLLGWVAIADREGEVSTGVSGGPELRGELLAAVRNGEDLNYALHAQLGLEDVGIANGFCGLATGDIVTRAQTDVQAVLFALAPFRNPQFFE